MRLSTCWNLLQRSLIFGLFSDYIHCICVGMDTPEYNLRTLVVGIKALHRIKRGHTQCIIGEKPTMG